MEMEFGEGDAEKIVRLLEFDCPDCAGTGKGVYVHDALRGLPCKTCEGTGKRLTEAGKAMLGFLLRHFQFHPEVRKIISKIISDHQDYR